MTWDSNYDDQLAAILAKRKDKVSAKDMEKQAEKKNAAERKTIKQERQKAKERAVKAKATRERNKKIKQEREVSRAVRSRIIELLSHRLYFTAHKLCSSRHRSVALSLGTGGQASSHSQQHHRRRP